MFQPAFIQGDVLEVTLMNGKKIEVEVVESIQPDQVFPRLWNRSTGEVFSAIKLFYVKAWKKLFNYRCYLVQE